MRPVQPHFAKGSARDHWIMQISVGANFMVMAFCAGYLALEYRASGVTWPYLVGALVIGYFIADFASGVVHWGMDTWFSERVFGRAVAIAREHHTHPQNILGYGFLEHSTLGSAPSALFIGLASLVTMLFRGSSVTAYCLMIVWLITSTCLFFGTNFHNLGHRRSKSRLLRLMQKLHLVITPEHHWVHHRSDQIVRYCVINGWANYLCDPLRIWRGLEWLVHALTGAEPRRDDLEWQRHYKLTGTLVSSYTHRSRATTAGLDAARCALSGNESASP
jgi:ubiquitin-conjugating enzyme E2 variant